MKNRRVGVVRFALSLALAVASGGALVYCAQEAVEADNAAALSVLDADAVASMQQAWLARVDFSFAPASLLPSEYAARSATGARVY